MNHGRLQESIAILLFPSASYSCHWSEKSNATQVDISKHERFTLGSKHKSIYVNVKSSGQRAHAHLSAVGDEDCAVTEEPMEG